MSYLHTPDAQEHLPDGRVLPAERPDRRPQQGERRPAGAVQDVFTAADLGGWDKLINDTVFGPNGAFTKAQKAAQG